MCFPNLVIATGFIKHFPVGPPRKAWKGCESHLQSPYRLVSLQDARRNRGRASSLAPRGRMERMSELSADPCLSRLQGWMLSCSLSKGTVVGTATYTSHSTAWSLGLQLPFGGLFCSDNTIFCLT